jgi:Mlc titration factor MtfA (ptsG expression regulator)
MGSIPLLLAVVVTLIIFGNFIYLFWLIIFAAASGMIEKLKIDYRSRVPSALHERYDPILLKSFPYYRKLSDKMKIRFMLRLQKFINSKTFSGCDGLEITDEIRVLISAAAIQLTFGLDRYLMDHFSEIFVYPEIFLSRVNDEYHKGETNIRGAIVFSWKDFYEGYAVENDKFNLGLHEMAHALELSKRLDGFDEFFSGYFSKWAAVALYEYENINNDRASFLRKYGGANIHEFFAVCVEHFFEAPAEFNSKLPDIYRHLGILLKQNPLLSYESNRESALRDTNQIPHDEFIKDAKFATTFSFRLLYLRTGLFLLLIVFLNFKTWNEIQLIDFILLIALSIVAALIAAALIFIRFQVFENYIVIRKPFPFNFTKSISFENLAGVYFYNYRYDRVEFVYVERQQMKTSSYYFSMNEQDREKLTTLLKEKKIPVRNTGGH